MSCPRCGRPGRKRLKGYCTKVHYKLDKPKLRKLILNCASCGAIVVRNPSAVAKSGRVFCKGCNKHKGETHPRWKQGQHISDDGYRIVLKDGRYQREHRVIWQEANRACLIPGSLASIHHIDFDKLNNSPDNLLLLSNEQHSRMHRFVDVGRHDEAAKILKNAADQQLHYPQNVDIFILRLFMPST